MCAGADAVVGYVCQAVLDPGDEAVTAWPSFPSYVIDPLKLAGSPVRVPLRDDRLDLDAMLGAITPRTKLVFIAAPNNPTGTTNLRADVDAYFDRVPPHVLTVLDQAYFEYIDNPGYPEGVATYLRAGHRVLVLRTFSKIYGLAGLRVGYGVGPDDVITAIGKVRRAFDVTSAGQEAALASLDAPEEVARRRAVNREAMALLETAVRENGFEPAWTGSCELPLRSRWRRCRALPGSAAARCHRASARRVRRTRCPPHHRGDTRGSRPAARGAAGVGRNLGLSYRRRLVQARSWFHSASARSRSLPDSGCGMPLEILAGRQRYESIRRPVAVTSSTPDWTVDSRKA